MPSNRKSPRAAAAGLIKINEALRSRLQQAEARVAELEAHLASLSDSNESQAEAEHSQALVMMHLSGLEAELAAFRAQHPESPLLLASGFNFADGTPKTVARVRYEEGFDEEGHRRQVECPHHFRTP